MEIFCRNKIILEILTFPLTEIKITSFYTLNKSFTFLLIKIINLAMSNRH
jgi:hypothetical protein